MLSLLFFFNEVGKRLDVLFCDGAFQLKTNNFHKSYQRKYKITARSAYKYIVVEERTEKILDRYCVKNYSIDCLYTSKTLGRKNKPFPK